MFLLRCWDEWATPLMSEDTSANPRRMTLVCLYATLAKAQDRRGTSVSQAVQQRAVTQQSIAFVRISQFTGPRTSSGTAN